MHDKSSMHGIRSGCDHWPCRHRPEIEMKQVFSKNGFTRVKIIDGGKTYLSQYKWANVSVNKLEGGTLRCRTISNFKLSAMQANECGLHFALIENK